MTLTRRGALGGAAALFAPSAKAEGPPAKPEGAKGPVRWTGKPQQGGFVLVHGRPGGSVYVDGARVGVAGPSGLAIVGFDRDASRQTSLIVQQRVQPLPVPSGDERLELEIAPVPYDVQRIDGLPTDQVTPSDPALLAKIKAQVARKTAAMSSLDETEHFKDGFAWPLARVVRTSRFGPQRILNGVPKTPHYGVDLAATAGTEIRAPAPGLVVFADPAMHFEGGLTLIDHGQGLISAYLHQSAQTVPAGQRVEREQVIGRVGATGRATGPHLCWRLTWRGRHMEPSLLIGARAPA